MPAKPITVPDDEPVGEPVTFDDITQPEAGEDGFECPECGKSLRSKAGLGTHRWMAHQIPGSNSHGGSGKRKAPTVPRGPRTPSVRENVLGMYHMIADIWAIKDPICAEALRDSAPAAAAAWAEQARRSPWVAKFWSDLAGATGWPALAMAHMPLLLSLQGHHLAPMLERRREAAEADFGGGAMNGAAAA